MKGLIRWTFALLGLTILLGGCESTLDLSYDSLPKLTIIGHLNPDSWELPRVYVYASLSPLDSTQFYTPSNLQVEVTELESDLTLRLDSIREDNKVYFIFPSNFLKEGLSYSIKAYAPGFEPVHATTEIPLPSEITNLSIGNIRIDPSEKNEFKNIVHYNLSFNIDHIQPNRYYHLIFYNAYDGLQRLYLIDPEPSDQVPFIRSYDFGILIDPADLRSGEPLTFNFVDWAQDNFGLRKVYVELRTITEGYYKYQSSLARQVIVRQDPFAEPVFIYNNIEGGYGNFSGFSSSVSSFDVAH